MKKLRTRKHAVVLNRSVGGDTVITIVLAIFGIFIYNFVGCISSTVVFITTMIAVFKEKPDPENQGM